MLSSFKYFLIHICVESLLSAGLFSSYVPVNIYSGNQGTYWMVSSLCIIAVFFFTCFLFPSNRKDCCYKQQGVIQPYQLVFLCSSQCYYTDKCYQVTISFASGRYILHTPASSIVLQQMLSCSNKCYCVPASVIIPQEMLLCSSKCSCALTSIMVLHQVLLCTSKSYCTLTSIVLLQQVHNNTCWGTITLTSKSCCTSCCCFSKSFLCK